MKYYAPDTGQDRRPDSGQGSLPKTKLTKRPRKILGPDDRRLESDREVFRAVVQYVRV